jgi:hypothetical protein
VELPVILTFNTRYSYPTIEADFRREHLCTKYFISLGLLGFRALSIVRYSKEYNSWETVVPQALNRTNGGTLI